MRNLFGGAATDLGDRLELDLGLRPPAVCRRNGRALAGENARGKAVRMKRSCGYSSSGSSGGGGEPTEADAAAAVAARRREEAQFKA